MARDASGNYSLPAGNPVTTGTTISSTWGNNTLSDIATELTDSASRSGKGGFTAPIRGANGSAAAPTHSFTNDTGVGIYRSAAGEASLAAGGGAVAKWTSVGFFASLLQSLTAVSLRLLGRAASTGTAVGVILDNDTNLNTAGDKLVSVRNATVEKASIDRNGKGSFVGLDAGSTTITSVATPSNSTDAATKGYVDGLIPTVVYTTADVTDNSGSNTYIDITGLSFSVAANKDYWFEADLVVAASVGTVGCGVQVTGPAAPTQVTFSYITRDNAGLFDQFSANAFSTAMMPANTPVARQVSKLSGIVRNGANSGTVQLQFATSNAATGSVTVYQGSTLRWKQLD